MFSDDIYIMYEFELYVIIVLEIKIQLFTLTNIKNEMGILKNQSVFNSQTHIIPEIKINLIIYTVVWKHFNV